MDNKTFGLNLEKRTKQFAIEVIHLSSSLLNSTEGKSIRNQISKSGTSLGANYREAIRAKNRKDFGYKMKICEGETSETVYWLELVNEMGWINKLEMNRLLNEAGELLALFSSAGKKLKN